MEKIGMVRGIWMDGMVMHHRFDFFPRWLSEKMDGIRAYWNGEKLITRHGKEVPCPEWFIEGLPSDIHLDGEMWLGREQFEDALTTLLNESGDEELWKSTRYVIFDQPSSKQPYEARMNELRDMELPPHIEIISSW